MGKRLLVVCLVLMVSGQVSAFTLVNRSTYPVPYEVAYSTLASFGGEKGVINPGESKDIKPRQDRYYHYIMVKSLFLSNDDDGGWSTCRGVKPWIGWSGRHGFKSWVGWSDARFDTKKDYTVIVDYSGYRISCKNV